MMPSHFMFVNDWTFSYNGKVLKLSKEDLKNYKENGLTEDDIKVIAFSYFSKQLFADFTKPETFEFDL